MPDSYSRTEDAVHNLTETQFRVTQKNGTEPPYRNAYWDNDEAGIYVDVVSGQPLFSSKDKFDSGTGWPSFSRPISPQAVRNEVENSPWSTRIEVRSTGADSHLGHLFDDGPESVGGLRYCMNSAALRFIPVGELEEQGYGQLLPLFEDESASSHKS